MDAATGERIFTGVRGFDDGALTVSELDRAYITAAEFLHLDGGHAGPPPRATRWMQAGGKVCWMAAPCPPGTVGPQMRAWWPGRHPHLWLGLASAHRQAGPVGDREGDSGHGPKRSSCRQRVRTGPTTTRRRFHTPSFDVEVLDTTGCGDVFHGAYIVGQLHGWGLRETAQFASAVAALKARKLGGRAGIPTFDETIAFLRERLGDWPHHPAGKE